jgi:hypothetical protein
MERTKKTKINIEMYAIARFWSTTPLNGADAVIPNATAAAKCKKKIHSDRAICQRQGAHTHVTIISPTPGGKYPIPKSMRYPENGPDGPSHQRASYPINHTDNCQRRQRTDVVRTNRRDDTGEEEARQGDILPITKKKRTISSVAHDIHIVDCRTNTT